MKVDWKVVAHSEGYKKFKKEILNDCTAQLKPGHKRNPPVLKPSCFNLVNGCTGGYRKNDCWNQPCKQFKYVIDLAKKFSLKLNISVDKILDIWEQNRRYNIYNFYQKYREGDLFKLIEESLQQ